MNNTYKKALFQFLQEFNNQELHKSAFQAQQSKLL